MADSADDRIADAAAEAAAAETSAAAAAVVRAEGELVQNLSTAAEVTTAAAQAGAALAHTNAAAFIATKEEELTWLRENVTQTQGILSEQAQRLQAMEQNQPKVLEQLAGIQTLVESLARPSLQQEPGTETPPAVAIVEKNEGENPDKKTEPEKPASPAAAAKKAIRFI